ncbi:hypothetical protein [Cellulomonas timonensis]|uniref:hypothetical protein n=1 Tax=Cellulomonas timonensis TaxID=1689271 RepID=UPI000830A770|nr:hypothetical protein [Cellulomonas timonensis]
MPGVGSRPLAPPTRAQLAGWRAHLAQAAADAEFEAHVADAVGLLVDEHHARPAGAFDEGAVAAAFALLDAADRDAARRARRARIGQAVFSAANVLVMVVASVLVAVVLLSWWAPPRGGRRDDRNGHRPQRRRPRHPDRHRRARDPRRRRGGRARRDRAEAAMTREPLDVPALIADARRVQDITAPIRALTTIPARAAHAVTHIKAHAAPHTWRPTAEALLIVAAVEAGTGLATGSLVSSVTQAIGLPPLDDVRAAERDTT